MAVCRQLNKKERLVNNRLITKVIAMLINIVSDIAPRFNPKTF
jgi:hypothetical protein